MGFVMAMVLIWLVFVRWGPWTRFACTSALYGSPRRPCGGRRYGRRHGMERSEPQTHRVTEEGAVELLRRRYVAGELSDEQYEEELDALFRRLSVRGRA